MHAFRALYMALDGLHRAKEHPNKDRVIGIAIQYGANHNVTKSQLEEIIFRAPIKTLLR